jgi:uncharacterized protein (DUF885 family)
MKKIILYILGIIFLGSTIFVTNLIWFKPFSVNLFYERVFVEFALNSPELISQLGLPIDAYNDELDDASDEANLKSYDKIQNDLATLHDYDFDSLNPQQQMSYRVMEAFLGNIAAGKQYRHYNYPVNQLFGVQNGFPSFMDSGHRVKSAEDAADYLSRLGKVKTKFTQVLGGLKLREQEGILPPTFVVDKVLKEMNGFIETAPKENILYMSFDKKLASVEDITDEEKQILRDKVAASIAKDVYPAYRILIDYFSELQPKTNTDAGVWKFPKGDDYYKYALKSMTTSDYTPQQIHQLGLSEVARISSEMLDILHQQGYQGEDLGAMMRGLGEEARFLYPDTDEAREQILVDYQTILDEINEGMDKTFSLRPKMGVEVLRIPKFKEKTAPGAYYQGPKLDGSSKGRFYANLYDIKATPKYGMRTLAYHEGIPGHHFQIALKQELEGLPMFRKMVPFTAYSEGWALYAERLAWEMGYEQDPFDNLGRLQAELFRAVRLVVDSGLHYKKWTREQAIEYMESTTGIANSDVVSEIERYIVMPGQACAYKIGMIKILELRARAKQQLGDKFDLKQFHKAVLENGAVPLNILEEIVDDYIAQAKG